MKANKTDKLTWGRNVTLRVHQYCYRTGYLMMFKTTNCEDLKGMAEE